ncbi:MAG: hypothetical protein J6T01_05220 [Kiritimatiellae bacterium]|nr:hypothetical protein [Kiritimatiellia bacterium]
MKSRLMLPAAAALLALSAAAQFALRNHRGRNGSAPVMAEGAFAALGGVRSIAAEIVWFRADRLQEEGRFVELAQLASALTFLEPHTPEVWSYAAWNLAYNVSIMMQAAEDRWRWVHAGLRLLRDEGLALNPRSKTLLRELAWMFEIKIGSDLDSAAAVYRAEWKKIVDDVRARGAWEELGMKPSEMLAVEKMSGFDDWTDPQLSAIYWAVKGGCADIVQQAAVIYRRNHSAGAGKREPRQ